MPGLRIQIDTSAAQRASAQLRSELSRLGSSAATNAQEFQRLEQRMVNGMGTAGAQRSLESLQRSLNMTRLETARFRASLGDFGGAFNTLSSGIGRAVFSIQGFAATLAAVGVTKFIKDVVDATLRVQAFQNSMQAITSSAVLAKDSMDFVSQTANKLGLNLVALESSYKNLAGSAMGTSLAGEQTEKIFTAVAKASAVLGLSADQTKGSLYAIGQMMSKGTVQAEELKGQLAERLPGAFQMAAKSMGVTTSQLQKMLEKGQVLATDLLPKLADELENRFGGAAETAGETARASFERFGNAIEELKRTLGNSGIVEYLAKIADMATAAVNTINYMYSAKARQDEQYIGAQKRIEELKELDKIEQANFIKNQKRQKEQQESSVYQFFKKTGVLQTDNQGSQTYRNQYAEEQRDLEKYVETINLKIETESLAQQKAIQHQRELSSHAKTNEETARKELQSAKEKEESSKRTSSSISSAAKKAANEQSRIAEQAAKEHIQILEKFQDDYDKITLNSADYQQLQLDGQKREYEKHVQDKNALNKWYASESKKIEDQRLSDSEKALKDYFGEIDDLDKDITDAARDEADQRAKDFQDALEQQRQDYEDFVYDVQSATSDMFVELFDGGFSSLFEEAKTLFKRTLANMASDAISRPIVIPVIQSIAGTVGGTVASAMGIPSVATQGGGFNASSITGVYNAVSGGLEGGVYKALTSGILNTAGSSIFGATAWGGAAGAELGWGATAAATTGMGTAGIASAIAAAAPWAAIAAVAIPLITKLFEDDPEPFLRVQTTSTSSQLSDPNYRWDTGEGKSSKFDYNLTMQDTDSAARKELGLAVTKMLDAQFTAIEDTLNVSVNDAIVAAQNAGGGYGEGFFSKIDLAAYSDDIAGGLAALSEDLFLDIRSQLTDQLTDGMSDIFTGDFFSGIAVDGEAAVDTFIRFGKVVESTDNFMEAFTRQTEVFGETAVQAYANIETISGIMTQMETAAKSFEENSAISALEDIDTAYQGLVATLQASNATVEQLNMAEQFRLQELGAAITGLTSNSVASALWTSIQQNQSAATFVQTLQTNVREGVGKAVVDGISNSISSAFISPINAAVGAMVSDIITGGVLTGAAIEAGVDELIRTIDGVLSLLDDPALIASIDTLISKFGGTVANPNAGWIDSTINSTSTTDTSATNTSTSDQTMSAGEQAWWNQNGKSATGTSDFNIDTQLSDMMKDIKDSISDSNLDEYDQEILKINRSMDDSIAKATALAASEQDLTDIRNLGAIEIKEATDKWIEDITTYTQSFNSLSDLLSETSESLASAVSNYSKFIGVAKDIGSESDLLSSAINEALSPLTTSFKELFQEIYVFGQTNREAAINEIVSQTNGFVDAINYLSDKGIFGLNELSGFVDGIYSIGKKLIDAKIMLIDKDSIESIGDLQAKILGKTQDFELMKLSDRYGSDLSTYSAQQDVVSNFSTMSYAKILEWSTANNIEIAELINDMSFLNDIVSGLSDSFEALEKTLKDYRNSLKMSESSYLSPEQKTDTARSGFLDLVQRSMSSDASVSQEAMAALPVAADQFLELSRKSNTSMLAYNTDMGLVLTSLKQAEDYASDYVDTTEDMSDEQAKTLKELQKGHLLAIRNNLNSMDKSLTDLFKDPALVSFFDSFSSVFGDDIIDSLNGNVGILTDSIDKFTMAEFWKVLQEMVDSGLAFSSESMDELRAIWSNVSFKWDSQATVEFWAKTASDFQGTFNNAMILLDFVKTESGGWNTPATVAFIQGFDRWNEMSIEDQMAALGFLLDTNEGDYVGRAALAFIAKLSDAGLAWDSVRQTMIDYGFDSTFVDYTIKAIYDNTKASEFGSWAEFSAAMKLTGKTEDIAKRVSAYFIGSGITISQTEEIMKSWGTSSTLTAAVTANMNMNVVSNTLLKETTFNDFARAFLGVSNNWKNGVPQGTYLQTTTSTGSPTTIWTVSLVEAIAWSTATLLAPLNKIAYATEEVRRNYGENLNGLFARMTNNLWSLNNGLKFPSYATGGYHSGGLRLVGERGPELEVTGASRIFSHEETMKMLSSQPDLSATFNIKSGKSDDLMKELIHENRLLREEVREMKEHSKQTRLKLDRINSRQDKWDAEGIPAERAA